MKANLIICRQEGNRLTAISGGATASFVYDADGNRVKSTVGGVTTVYIAGVFEFIENGATDKMNTYYDGNAMRRSGYGIDDGVYYLLQDHLKSSSSFVNQSGATLANNYYYPYGGNRAQGAPGAFSNLTTKRFTGQYHESRLPGGEGLSYYNARWYDPKLGRFLSADTIVPDPHNPQAFNRYSYVFNNPLKYIDPNGHCPSASVPGGSGEENRAAWAENGRCTALVNTILNSWDKTDYWQKKWPDKEAFKKHLGDSPTTDYDFFLPYWMEYLAYEKQWDAAHPSTPCAGCSRNVEQDFGDYTSFSIVVPLNTRIGIGGYEAALIIDDLWNFYYRTGSGVGTWGVAVTRGDVLILQDGRYVDVDNLSLSTEQKSMLLQERIPGISSSVSGGTFIFAGGVSTSADGETMTFEGGLGFPRSVVSVFWAPESVTNPWFSWR